MEIDPTVWTLQARLIDRFGDNGMIGVVICKPRATKEWEIDTWLMSCRVLGRRFEEATLNEIVAGARAAGIARLIGRYIPTKKNGMVEEHYRRLGFAQLPGDGSSTLWSLDVATFKLADVPMKIARQRASVLEQTA